MNQARHVTATFDSDSQASLRFITNPTDALLLSVEQENGSLVDFFGTRDNKGLPINIERVNVKNSEGELTTVELDLVGRPIKIISSDGYRFELSYISDKRGTISAVGPDGETQITAAFAADNGDSTDPVADDFPSILTSSSSNPPSEISPFVTPISTRRNLSTTDSSLLTVDVQACGGGVSGVRVNASMRQPGTTSWWSGKNYPATETAIPGIYEVHLPTEHESPSWTSGDLLYAAEKIAKGLGLACSLSTAEARQLTMGSACAALNVKPVVGQALSAVCFSKIIPAVELYCGFFAESGVPNADDLATKILQAIQDPNYFTGNIELSARAVIPALGEWQHSKDVSPSGPFGTIALNERHFSFFFPPTTPPEFGARNPLSGISRVMFDPVLDPHANDPYGIKTQVMCPQQGDTLSIDIERRFADGSSGRTYHWESPAMSHATQEVVRQFPPATKAATDTIVIKHLAGAGVVSSRTLIVDIHEHPRVNIIGEKTVTHTLRPGENEYTHLFSAIGLPQGLYRYRWDFGDGSRFINDEPPLGAPGLPYSSDVGHTYTLNPGFKRQDYLVTVQLFDANTPSQEAEPLAESYQKLTIFEHPQDDDPPDEEPTFEFRRAEIRASNNLALNSNVNIDRQGDDFAHITVSRKDGSRSCQIEMQWDKTLNLQSATSFDFSILINAGGRYSVSVSVPGGENYTTTVHSLQNIVRYPLPSNLSEHHSIDPFGLRFGIAIGNLCQGPPQDSVSNSLVVGLTYARPGQRL